mmetsp:Transcript_9024/g.31437  ORF Transcript_9024/g.31437 Transcript_9024/m.31437 type:complete len:227 (+) Transcript_9024:724-1404(+)
MWSWVHPTDPVVPQYSSSNAALSGAAQLSSANAHPAPDPKSLASAMAQLARYQPLSSRSASVKLVKYWRLVCASPTMRSRKMSRHSQWLFAVLSPPWSSRSAPSSVEQPYCARATSRTVGVIMRFTVPTGLVYVPTTLLRPSLVTPSEPRNSAKSASVNTSAWRISCTAVSSCIPHACVFAPSELVGSALGSRLLGQKFMDPERGRMVVGSNEHALAMASVSPSEQ